MLPDKKFRSALVASVLLNTACVAWVGGSSLTHPPKPVKPHEDPSAKLHAVPVALHKDKKTAAKPDGDKNGHGRPGNAEGGNPSDSSHSSSGGGSNATASGQSGSGDGDPGKPMAQVQTANAAGKGQQPKTEEGRNDPDPEHSNAPRQFGTTPGTTQYNRPVDKRFMTAMSLPGDRNGAMRAEASRRPDTDTRRDTRQSTQTQQQVARNDMQDRPAGAAPNQSPQQAQDKGAKPGTPSQSKQEVPAGKQLAKSSASTKTGKPGGSQKVTPGNSVSSKLNKPDKMKIDLGTVHMTRPKHGITGGGYSDMRNVDITAHFVVDDAKNAPKNLKPDKIVKKFKTLCIKDPGNTSKCLPTGGNTKLGGYSIPGHNHITGVKYCVPGSGGIPGGGSKQSQSQSRQGKGKTGQGEREASGRGDAASSGAKGDIGKYVGQAYHGPGSAKTVAFGTDGRTGPGDSVSINPIHLPGHAADNHGFVPGAEVPKENQEWVADPEAHKDTAPTGNLITPMPRFRVAVRSVGSLSAAGTVDWGQPHKPRPKKKPKGGDGTGLLGIYYNGMNFNKFAFKRPDRNIDFDWVYKGPGPLIPGGRNFSVRWLGDLVPDHTDDYTLMIASDDGERVYVDGKLILSNWSIHGPTEDMATIHLQAHHHYSFKLEYFENQYGQAVTKLYWEGPNTPRQYIPESCFRYPKDRL